MNQFIPFVSVIIPTYNRAHMICRAIDSVLKQTFINWELIVVDDNSNDNTHEIIKTFYPQIFYTRHSKNLGGSAARNTGLSLSQGEYIAFLDSDDEWLPTKLQEQLAIFDKGSPKLGLVYTGLIIVPPKLNSVFVTPVYRGSLYRQLLLSNVIGSTSSPIVQRRVFDDVGNFDETLPALQDLDLWVRISRIYECDFCQNKLVRLHTHSGKERISVDTANIIQGWKLFFIKHKEEMIQEKVISICMRKIGQISQYFFDLKGAREYYINSILANKYQFICYCLLLSTLLPKQFYRLILKLKIKVKI